ncbi:MAG: prepilin-type N-terminal cleavage/methylation domain-containing protein, partial [bacterium]
FRRCGEGFTLIELLIVVAIIGILAAIAIPNFLNARLRANITRTKADLRMLDQQAVTRHLDTGLWLIDGNDCHGEPECCFPEGGSPFYHVVPGNIYSGVKIVGIGTNHFDGRIWFPLTTPVSYIASIPLDPFGKGYFFGYEDRECSNAGGSHYLMFACGPDSDYGDWETNRHATPFNMSNGLQSSGDIWRSRKLRDAGRSYFEEIYGDYWD